MLKCSHILCKVDNIHDCVDQLERAGFTVQWGGDPTRAHNALVWFEHGPFLEFFELPRWFRWLSVPFGWRFGRCAGRRLFQWATAASGWCDVALEPLAYQQEAPLNLTGVNEYLRKHSINGSRVVKGSRTSASGGKVHYRFMTLQEKHQPFIVSHYYPQQRPPLVKHVNGAVGVSRVDFYLPAASQGTLKLLLPEDSCLQSHACEKRHISGVTLRGWQPPPETPAFIHSLFTSSQEN